MAGIYPSLCSSERRWPGEKSISTAQSGDLALDVGNGSDTICSHRSTADRSAAVATRILMALPTSPRHVGTAPLLQEGFG